MLLPMILYPPPATSIGDVALLTGAKVRVYSSVHVGPHGMTCRSHIRVAHLPRDPWPDDEE
jgi:hypothetical protein